MHQNPEGVPQIIVLVYGLWTKPRRGSTNIYYPEGLNDLITNYYL